MYYVYVIESIKDKNLYIGHTDNLIKRFKEHNIGLVQYKNRKPLNQYIIRHVIPKSALKEKNP